MCRVKGFIRLWSIRFARRAREAAKDQADAEHVAKHAAKLRRLANKKKELDKLRRTK